VMLDAERCILCSRCVRFADEITKTSELGIVNRGDHSEIAVHPDRELNNKYSGNVVDICPVGALTDKDFRFKCRVWYLQKTDSICPGCSRGCNIEIHYNLDRPQHGEGARVMRLKPRENPEVNKWWICDAGRYGYKFIDENRIPRPVFRDETGVKEINWEPAIDQVAGLIQKAGRPVGVFLSPQMSNEELEAAKGLFGDKKFQVFFLSPNPEGDQDDFLIRADKNPNTRGGELLGFHLLKAGKAETSPLHSFLADCEAGKIEGAVIFGQDLLTVLEPRLVEPALNALAWKVFIGPNHNLTSESSTYVLPSATYAEKCGTFTNFEGRVQKFQKAFEPQGQSRPEIEILQDLASRLGVGTVKA